MMVRIPLVLLLQSVSCTCTHACVPSLVIRPGFEYTMIYQDSWPEYQEYHAISEYQAEYQQNTTNGNTKHYQKKRAPGVKIIYFEVIKIFISIKQTTACLVATRCHHQGWPRQLLPRVFDNG